MATNEQPRPQPVDLSAEPTRFLPRLLWRLTLPVSKRLLWPLLERQNRINRQLSEEVELLETRLSAALSEKDALRHHVEQLQLGYDGIRSRLEAQGLEIAAERPAVDPARLEGSLDAVTGWTVSGWAWDRTRPDAPLTVDIYDNRHKVGSTVADLFRHDLQKHGKGNGEHGFAFNLANVFDPAQSSILFSGEAHSIAVKVQGCDDFRLANSPIEMQLTAPDPGERQTEGKFCAMPFEKFVIDAGGRVFLCCPSYLPVSVGNAYKQSFEEIWNSDMAKELRRSIVDGDFKYCLDSCPAIQKGLLPEADGLENPRWQRALGEHDFTLSHGPSHLSLLHDRTCNLSCPSCRTEVLVALGSETDRLKHALDNVISPMLRSVETLEFAGGELFASKHLREVLHAIDREQHPSLRIAYFSNGTLFNEEEWTKFGNIHGMFKLIYVSMDAARSDTFRELRRGATLDQVLPNLRFISSLRRAGHVEEFGILFVVQERNFEEMAEFVELGRDLGCDTVKFHRLMNFGTYPAGEFEQRDICAAGHPRHGELVEILARPVFQEPLVDLGNLFELLEETSASHGAHL